MSESDWLVQTEGDFGTSDTAPTDIGCEVSLEWRDGNDTSQFDGS